jgi:hypothetical protein
MIVFIVIAEIFIMISSCSCYVVCSATAGTTARETDGENEAIAWRQRYIFILFIYNG